jgi:hypothetical protein
VIRSVRTDVVTTTSWFESTAHLTPEDKSLVYRVVGFLEYSMALRNLDEFVKQASKEELQAADEWVADRPEFTIYTNLSRRVQSAQSTLAPASKNDDRQGLAWVTALARVELGGILATFSSYESPYEVVGPTQFDLPAYRELLMDASQSHVWALANDRELDRAASGVPDTKMLAYLRRVGLIRLLLNAAARANAKELARAQMQELVAQDNQLQNQQDRFGVTIATYLRAMNAQGASTTSKTVDVEMAMYCKNTCKRQPRFPLGQSTNQGFNFGSSP